MGAAFVVYGNYRAAIDNFEGGPGIRTVGLNTSSAGLFCTYPAAFMTRTGMFFSEFVASTILMFCIYSFLDAGAGDLLPLCLFFLIFGIGACFGWETGYAINLARDFGPRLVSYIVGYGPDVWSAGGYYFWVSLNFPTNKKKKRRCWRPVILGSMERLAMLTRLWDRFPWLRPSVAAHSGDSCTISSSTKAPHLSTPLGWVSSAYERPRSAAGRGQTREDRRASSAMYDYTTRLLPFPVGVKWSRIFIIIRRVAGHICWVLFRLTGQEDGTGVAISKLGGT